MELYVETGVIPPHATLKPAPIGAVGKSVAKGYESRGKET